MHDQQVSQDTGRPRAGFPSSSLAVGGDGFGWGSVGRLGAVIDAIRRREDGRTRFLGLDTSTGRPVLRRHNVHEWADTSGLTDAELRELLARHSVEAAVVVLNAKLALRLERVGCPVIYIDSIPFMWTEHELIPQAATRYIAQLCPLLPDLCWPVLRGITSLHWVSRVVGPRPSLPAAAAVPGKAVINFGGLQSPATTGESIASYVRLVSTAMLTALKEHGYDQVVITGNLDVDNLPFAADLTRGLRLSGGRLPREQFMNELASADLIATSPGQMTLLEIGSLGRRAVLLPPQNLSQTMTAAEVTQIVDPDIVVAWPPGTVDQDRIIEERARGEEWAIVTMYREISAAAAAWPEGIPQLAHACSAALAYARDTDVSLAPLSVTGDDGADEVVGILHSFLQSTRAGRPGPA